MERGSGISLWRQIHERLKSDIVSGAVKPGEMLPTEHALAERFGVNRHTIRRAVQALAENGLVVTRQGSGTYVPETVVDYTVKKRTRFSEVVSAQSRMPEVRMIETFSQTGTADQLRGLGLRRGARVLCIRTLGVADDIPLSLANHYFAAGRFADLGQAVKETGSISKGLAALGIDDFTRKTTRVMARMPSREEAELLQQPMQRPVLLAESVNVMADGKPLEYGYTLFAGDRTQMVFEP